VRASSGCFFAKVSSACSIAHASPKLPRDSSARICVIAFLLIHEAQVHERLDELLGVAPALRLRFEDFVGDLRKCVLGAGVCRGLRGA